MPSTAGSSSPERPGDFIRLGRIADFAGGQPRLAYVGEVSVVVVEHRGTCVVVENRCPHQQAERFHEGEVAGGLLTCPLHGRSFRLDDGVCVNGAGRLTILLSRAQDGDLWVRPPQPPPFQMF